MCAALWTETQGVEATLYVAASQYRTIQYRTRHYLYRLSALLAAVIELSRERSQCSKFGSDSG